MNKTSSSYRRIGWVAVLALMLQVLLPVLHPVMAAGVTPGQSIRICSTMQKTSDAGKATQQKSTQCPICMAMHLSANGFVPPQDVVLVVVNRSPLLQTAGVYNIVAPVFTVSSAQPRAPPSFA